MVKLDWVLNYGTRRKNWETLIVKLVNLVKFCDFFFYVEEVRENNKIETTLG